MWKIKFSKLSQKDFSKLDGSIKQIVLKSLKKVSENPTSSGYGKSLSKPLDGCYKVKLKKHGIRITYKLSFSDEAMHIIVIGIRSDNEVYIETEKRLDANIKYF